MLKLSSPELAKFLTSSQTLPSGSTLPTPTAGSGSYLFPKNVTEEQELYAKGFEDALSNLKHTDNNSGDSSAATPEYSRGYEDALKRAKSNQPGDKNATAIDTIERATSAHSRAAAGTGGQIPLAVTDMPSSAVAVPPPLPPAIVVSRPSSGASGSIDSSECGSATVKEEEADEDDDSDDDSMSEDSKAAFNSSLSPIDMKNQEKIKLERKRLRNRVAASKCRKRKLERISQLDDRVSALKGENSELAAVVKKLKASVCELKQEVMEHVGSGCQIMIAEDSAAFT
jgi:hypothetical protein